MDPVTLTPAAAEHVRRMLARRGRGIGLRLTTRRSGCSGLAYVVDYADALEEGEVQFESHGVQVVVPQDQLPLLQGTEIDFVRENLLNQGFEFHNPNVKSSCGCGESFSV